MARKHKTVRVHVMLPEIVMQMWENAWTEENGYLPFNLTQRIEIAIMQHTRELQRLIDERGPAGGGGGGEKRRETEEESNHDNDGERGHWHREPALGAPGRWQDYLQVG